MQKTQQKKEKRAAETTVYTGCQGAEVLFQLDRPQARAVYLCGDFNQWFPSSLRMIRRDENGLWERRLMLTPGRYEYKFIVDGEWTSDPRGVNKTTNAFGSINSVMEVPG